jgi:hypothetical protein
VYSFSTTEYSRELPVKPVETKWHDVALDLIIMLNGTFVLPQVLASRGGVLLGVSVSNYTGNFYSKTHQRNVRVAVSTEFDSMFCLLTSE